MCNLARCILAPFYIAPASPVWRTADVVDVALGAYEDRGLPEGARTFETFYEIDKEWPAESLARRKAILG